MIRSSSSSAASAPLDQGRRDLRLGPATAGRDLLEALARRVGKRHIEDAGAHVISAQFLHQTMFIAATIDPSGAIWCRRAAGRAGEPRLLDLRRRALLERRPQGHRRVEVERRGGGHERRQGRSWRISSSTVCAAPAGFHPLCGADPVTLLGLLARKGPPSAAGLLPFAIALASSLGRLPFTAAERAWSAYALRRAGPLPPPIFILGHMRSGTTHLHNLLAASGQFATVPPVLAGMPWEAFGLARVLRPFVEQYLPADRLIDRVRVGADSPTEDEIALANMHALSYYHAIYFPRRFAKTYRRGLLPDDGTGEEVARWQRTLRHYVGKMAALGAGRPLLLKNPAYTARIGAIRALWPEARFVHIYRDPYVVFESTCRALRTVLRELALQGYEHVAIEEVVLEVYPRLMGSLLEQADRLPPDRIVHLRFEELERDPLDALESIYASIGLEGYPAAQPRIEAYLDSIRDYRKSAYAFSTKTSGASPSAGSRS
ncbi:MAG: sulfotransferase [Geminicoccaceae bacterium]|nr:sulfotransferase [Geminicoccaceae bacterium]